MAKRVDNSEEVKKVKKTFTNWFNDRLRGNLKVAKHAVKDLEHDLTDGILLIVLLENLAKPRKVGRYTKNPTTKIQCLENLSLVFKFIKSENIKLVNIGPEDIYNCNLKLILGLIWTLIGHFQIKSSGHGLSTKQAMREWLHTQIPNYNIQNFNTDWNDGRAVCGLVDRLKPGLCPNHASLSTSNGLENCRLGMTLAEENFEIPMILEPEDLSNPDVDDLSVMTYISYFFVPACETLLLWLQAKIPHCNISNLSTDWNNGINLAALMDACHPGLMPTWKDMDPHKAHENLEKCTKLSKDRLDIQCPVGPAEFSNPKVDEIIVATYLSRFKYSKLLAKAEDMRIHEPDFSKTGAGLVKEPIEMRMDLGNSPEQVLGLLSIKAAGPTAEAVVTIEGSHNSKAKFIPLEVGTYIVSCHLNDDEIHGSPVSVAVIDPSEWVLSEKPPQYLLLNKPHELAVTGKTYGSNPLIDVDVTNEDGYPSNCVTGSILMEDEDNVLVTLTPSAIGKANVSVTVAGKDIKGSPFTVSICNPEKCQVSGLDGNELILLGKPTSFSIDANGCGDVKPEAKVTAPDGDQKMLDLVEIEEDDNEGSSQDADEEEIDSEGSEEIQENDSVGVTGIDEAEGSEGRESLVLEDEGSKGLDAGGSGRLAAGGSGGLAAGGSGGLAAGGSGELAAGGSGGLAAGGSGGLAAGGSGGLAAGGSGGLAAGGSGGLAAGGSGGLAAGGSGGLAAGGSGGLAAGGSGGLAAGGSGGLAAGGSGRLATEGSGGLAAGGSGGLAAGGSGRLATEGSGGLAAGGSGGLAAGGSGGLASGGRRGEKRARDSNNIKSKTKSKGEVVKSLGGSKRKGKRANDNMYTASFIPTESGEHEIAITIGGAPVPGSPFTLPVLDTSDWKVSTDIPRHLPVGKTLHLQLKGPNVGDPEVNFTITNLSGNDEDEIIKKDTKKNKAGDYTLTLTPVKVGQVKGQVQVAENNVLSFNTTIVDPQKIIMTDWDGSESFVNEPITFTLDTTGAGDEKPLIKAKGPMLEYSPEARDNRDGSYTYSFMPKEPGPVVIPITLAGVDIPGSPFHKTITNVADPNLCSAKGPGLAQAFAGKPARFGIITPEAGLLAKRSDALTVDIVSSDRSMRVESKIEDLNNKTYGVTYTVPVVGQYLITVKFYGNPIPGCDFKLTAYPPPNASKCRIYGPAMHPNALHFRGRPLELYVDTKSAGYGELQAVVQGPKKSSPKLFVADDDEGIYSLRIDTKLSGWYRINIWWEQVHVPLSPINIRVHTAPDHTKVRAYGPGLSSQIDARNEVEFFIETEDAGIGTLTVVLHGVKDAFKIDVKPVDPTNPRQLRGVYCPQEGGDYEVTIKWSDIDVLGSPFKVKVIDHELLKEEREREMLLREKEREKKRLKKRQSSQQMMIMAGTGAPPVGAPVISPTYVAGGGSGALKTASNPTIMGMMGEDRGQGGVAVGGEVTTKRTVQKVLRRRRIVREESTSASDFSSDKLQGRVGPQGRMLKKTFSEAQISALPKKKPARFLRSKTDMSMITEDYSPQSTPSRSAMSAQAGFLSHKRLDSKQPPPSKRILKKNKSMAHIEDAMAKNAGMLGDETPIGGKMTTDWAKLYNVPEEVDSPPSPSSRKLQRSVSFDSRTETHKIGSEVGSKGGGFYSFQTEDDIPSEMPVKYNPVYVATGEIPFSVDDEPKKSKRKSKKK